MADTNQAVSSHEQLATTPRLENWTPSSLDAFAKRIASCADIAVAVSAEGEDGIAGLLEGEQDAVSVPESSSGSYKVVEGPSI
jgi:hypothetical protein